MFAKEEAARDVGIAAIDQAAIRRDETLAVGAIEGWDAIPGHAGRCVMHDMQIVEEKQGAPKRPGFADDGPPRDTGMSAMFGKGPHQGQGGAGIGHAEDIDPKRNAADMRRPIKNEGGCRQVKDIEVTANLGWANPMTGSAMVMRRG